MDLAALSDDTLSLGLEHNPYVALAMPDWEEAGRACRVDGSGACGVPVADQANNLLRFSGWRDCYIDLIVR